MGIFDEIISDFQCPLERKCYIKVKNGKRCKDYEAGCGCRQAWSIFDTIIGEGRIKI